MLEYSSFFTYFMESKLMKVRLAAIFVFPNLYTFEGEEVDKRSEKAERTVLVIYCCLLLPRGKNPKRS